MNNSLSRAGQVLIALSGSLLLCLTLLTPARAADVTAQSLTISEAWVRTSVPGQVNGAGYMQIQNKGTQTDRLLSATATAAGKVELHTVINENGVAKMREINALDIPAAQTIRMAPGGFHVMFIQLKEPFKEGSTVPVTLKFEKAGEVKVDFVAKPATYNPGSAAGHAHQSAHNHEQHNHAQHSAHHQAPGNQLDPLFISLTTDEPARVSMALSMAQHHSTTGRPLTIFLSDKGVHLGLKASKDTFPEQQQMLNAIIAKGGVVVVCPPCLKHFNKTESDLMPGVKLGGPQVTGELLFREGTRTLSW